MRVSFAVWSSPNPVGGVVVLYRFANALAERGHEVNLLHHRYVHMGIRSMDELSWFDFDPRIRHSVMGDEPTPFPEADVIFGTGAPSHAGLPVHLVQGREILFTALERSAYRTPGLKIAVASWLTDAGEQWGWPAERCEVVHIGIDHETFRVRTGVGDRPPTVALLHHAHPAKGWRLGLAALEQVQRTIPELRAIAFGTSAPPEGLPPWVDFRGEVSQHELATEIYDQSRIFLQASTVEGFGLPAVEAMASGCALVTTDNGGSRDYAFPGRTALVCDTTTNDLARGVTTLLTDPVTHRRVAEAGVAEIAKFRWSRSAEQLEALLLDYIARPDAYLLEPGPERSELQPGALLPPEGVDLGIHDP